MNEQPKFIYGKVYVGYATERIHEDDAEYILYSEYVKLMERLELQISTNEDLLSALKEATNKNKE